MSRALGDVLGLALQVEAPLRLLRREVAQGAPLGDGLVPRAAVDAGPGQGLPEGARAPVGLAGAPREALVHDGLVRRAVQLQGAGVVRVPRLARREVAHLASRLRGAHPSAQVLARRRVHSELTQMPVVVAPVVAVVHEIARCDLMLAEASIPLHKSRRVEAQIRARPPLGLHHLALAVAVAVELVELVVLARGGELHGAVVVAARVLEGEPLLVAHVLERLREGLESLLEHDRIRDHLRAELTGLPEQVEVYDLRGNLVPDDLLRLLHEPREGELVQPAPVGLALLPRHVGLAEVDGLDILDDARVHEVEGLKISRQASILALLPRHVKCVSSEHESLRGRDDVAHLRVERGDASAHGYVRDDSGVEKPGPARAVRRRNVRHVAARVLVGESRAVHRVLAQALAPLDGHEDALVGQCPSDRDRGRAVVVRLLP